MPQLPPFQEWLIQLVSMLSDILLGVAAIVGIWGLWEWRRELIGKTKFDVARRLTLLALQFRDEFHGARRVFTLAGESAEREVGTAEHPSETRVADEYFSRSRRLLLLQETLRKLLEAGWEAEIILSEENADLVRPFDDAFRELFVAMGYFFEEEMRLAKGGSPTGPSAEKHRELRKVIYGLSDDPTGKTVDETVDRLKKRMRKYVR
jgi:hypothetical protein